MTARFRAGDLAAAIAEHTKLGGGDSLSQVLNWLPLAMAHHKAGRHDEARQRLDKGDRQTRPDLA